MTLVLQCHAMGLAKLLHSAPLKFQCSTSDGRRGCEGRFFNLSQIPGTIWRWPDLSCITDARRPTNWQNSFLQLQGTLNILMINRKPSAEQYTATCTVRTNCLLYVMLCFKGQSLSAFFFANCLQNLLDEVALKYMEKTGIMCPSVVVVVDINFVWDSQKTCWMRHFTHWYIYTHSGLSHSWHKVNHMAWGPMFAMDHIFPCWPLMNYRSKHIKYFCCAYWKYFGWTC